MHVVTTDDVTAVSAVDAVESGCAVNTRTAGTTLHGDTPGREILRAQAESYKLQYESEEKRGEADTKLSACCVSAGARDQIKQIHGIRVVDPRVGDATAESDRVGRTQLIIGGRFEQMDQTRRKNDTRAEKPVRRASEARIPDFAEKNEDTCFANSKTIPGTALRNLVTRRVTTGNSVPKSEVRRMMNTAPI